MPKKKKKQSKIRSDRMNYEIANEFGVNNGPNEVSNKNSRSSKSCHRKGRKS